MDTRTIQQERRYTMALGYAWGRKDATTYGTESGKRAMTTSALDFAGWFAIMGRDESSLEHDWQTFSELSPSEQRRLVLKAKILLYAER